MALAGVVEEIQARQGYHLERHEPFQEDMKRIISQLMVVDNNGPDSIGGGGQPLAPLAPPLRSRSLA